MGTTLCALALVETDRRRAPGHRQRGRLARLPAQGRRSRADHRRPQPGGHPRAPGPADRGRGCGAPAAQHHHPGPGHRHPGHGRLVGGPAGARATGTCCAATACSTRWRRAGSRPRCASWPHPTRPPASWCAWPTRAAAATTSPWWWSTCEGDADARRAEPRSAPTATATAAGDRSDDRVIRAVSGETRAIGERRPSRRPRRSRRRQQRAARRAAQKARDRTARRGTSPGGCWPSWWPWPSSSASPWPPSPTTPATPTSSGFDGDTVAIYQGRPGRACCGSSPSWSSRPASTRATVPDGLRRTRSATGKLEPTLADAHRYLTNVRDVASAQGSTPAATAPRPRRRARPPPPTAATTTGN